MMRRIDLLGREISYDLQRKNVKNINLRIYPDGRISVSAHRLVREETVARFLESHAERILRSLDRFAVQRQSAPAPFTYSDGETILLLGEPYRLCVQEGKKKEALLFDGVLMLRLPKPEDVEQRKKLLDGYLDALCRTTVTRLCEQIHPSFAPLGVEYPALRFRRMRSRWGSCHIQKKTVTFNLALVAEPIACIEYVVWHELVHFLHPDHSKEFYQTLARYLPDWRERRDRLNKKQTVA